MSPKNSRLKASLTALGLFAAAPVGVVADTPPAPSAPVARELPAPATAPVGSVLLLKNGALHQGIVSDAGRVYVVQYPSGKIPVPKQNVELVAHSIREIYEYKLGRLPERDPDEHMKLARWCLTQRMTEEAKEQLQKVVALSPRDTIARHMIEKINGEEERASLRDPAVAQASVEMPAARPDALDPAILGRARRDLGVSSLPEIPGLPPALAVKRSNEFAFYIDHILQLRCAKCHNEQFAGSFQLINYRSRADRTRDALRANFDATLKLVDFENPEKSELLSSTLRRHGKGANAQPIFTGSNNPEYRILARWVNGLRAPGPAAAAPGARPGLASAPDGQGFGAQRTASLPMPPPLTPTPPSSSLDTRPQLTVGDVIVDHPDASPTAEFPAPYLMGGPRPKLPGGAGTEVLPANLPPPAPGNPKGAPVYPSQVQPAGALPPPAPGNPPGAPVYSGQAQPAGALPLPAPGNPPGAPVYPGQAQPGIVLPPPAPGNPPGAPVLPGQAQLQAAAGAAATPRAKSKPVKIDPALLEKTLQYRNAGPPQ